MDAKAHPLVSLLRRRLEALQALAHEIAAGQDACVALNLEELQMRDEKKSRLCELILSLDQEIAHLGPSSAKTAKPTNEVTEEQAGGLKAETALAIQHLWRECEAACANVAFRNKVYAEFLRRSRCTLIVLQNVVAYCLGVYPDFLTQQRRF